MALYLDDRKLVKRLLAGNEAAFASFFDENFARLYRFAAARLPDEADAAREVVQSTLARAVRKLHTYRAESALFTWLCAICRNEISDWLRQNERYREHIVLIEDSDEIRAAVDSLQMPSALSPEQDYRRLETLRLIQVALDRLPPHYGNVLEWKYVEGHSTKEIAARLDLGNEAVQSLLARAKRAFAEVYVPLGAGSHEDTGLIKP